MGIGLISQPVAGAEDMVEAAAHRLLDPLDMAILHPAHKAQRLCLAPRGVRIDADIDIRPHRRAHVVYQLDLAVRLEVAHRQLDIVEAVLANDTLQILGITLERNGVFAVEVGKAVPRIRRDRHPFRKRRRQFE